MRRSYVLAFIVVALLALWLACGGAVGSSGNPPTGGRTVGGPSGPTTGTTGFLFGAENGGQRVLAASINPANGVLTPVTGSPFDTGTGAFVTSVSSDRGGQFVFASVTATSSFGVPLGQDAISAFAVDRSTGALRLGPNSPLALTNSAPLVADPGGAFVFMPLPQGGIDVFQVAADATLTRVQGAPFAGPAGGSAQPVINSSGTLLYSIGRGLVAVWNVNPATGQAALVSGAPFPTGGFFERRAVLTPDGRFLLAANATAEPQFANGNVLVLSTASTGLVTPTLPPTPTLGGNPSQIVITPDARFVFVTTDQSGGLRQVEGFTFDTITGRLTPIAGSPFVQGLQQGGLAVDNSGQFLFVSDASTTITFRIDSTTGVPTRLTDSATPGGQWMTVTP